MRRLLVVLAILALGCPSPTRADAPPTGSVPGAPRTEWLDVGIVIDAGQTSVRVEQSEPVRGIPALRELPAGAQLSVRPRRGGTLEITDDRGTEHVLAAGDTLFVGGPGSEAVHVGTKRYRGGAKVFVSPRGKIAVANRVSVQSYLRGVLPHEIGRLEPATVEAGKAQAVAARTYTLSYVGRRAAEGFDLFDSVEDQVYGGTVDESAFTDRAVLETAGIVALHDGAYIRANYHSTCGGATVNVEDVWPDPPFPWLRQVEDGRVDDAWCKSSRHFRWVERWTGAQVLANLTKYGPEQSGIAPPRGGWKELRDVRVASRTPSGRVRELVFVTEAGTIVVFADRTRWVLRRNAADGGGILRSSLFKVGVRKDRRGRVTEVVASGGGNGHGAGMCQVGALAQARAGRTYGQILRAYYTGIDVVRL
jgi:stage II sporulation protein D